MHSSAEAKADLCATTAEAKGICQEIALHRRLRREKARARPKMERTITAARRATAKVVLGNRHMDHGKVARAAKARAKDQEMVAIYAVVLTMLQNAPKEVERKEVEKEDLEVWIRHIQEAGKSMVKSACYQL